MRVHLWFPLILSLVGNACSKPDQPSDSSGEATGSSGNEAGTPEPVPHEGPAAEAAPPYDAKDAYAMQQMLRRSDTRLTLSTDDLAVLEGMLPKAALTLLNGFVPRTEIETVTINANPEVFLALTMKSAPYDHAVDGQPVLRLEKQIEILGIEPPAGDISHHRIAVRGLSIGGRAATHFWLLTSGEMVIALAGGEAATWTTPELQELFAQGDPLLTTPLPTSAVMVRSLFEIADRTRQADADNVLDLRAMRLDADGEPVLDAQGRMIPDTDNIYRRLVRDHLAKSGLEAQYLAVLDQITGIRLDRQGVRLGLARATTINNPDGYIVIGTDARVAAQGPATVIPQSGISAVAYAADGASVQRLRFVPDGTADGGWLAADVYGWRKTLFGTFGETRTVAIALP